MGQTQSAALPSKQELLAKTKGGSNLVNQLFTWMIGQASIRDFYLMANPVHCKKYIMLTANVLQQVFSKIDVYPQAGPQGTIYFRKVDALNPQDKSDPLYKHREINCLRLAFLYVRIFQIFAALSLTILDVDPELEKGFLQDISRLQNMSTIPLFGPSGQQRGGALDAKRPLPIGFEVLRSSLSEIPQNPLFYKFSGTPIYIEYSAVGPDGSIPIEFDYSSTDKRQRRKILGRILIERRGGDKITIQLLNLKQYLGSEEYPLGDTKVYLARPSVEALYQDQSGRSIPEALSYVFQKLALGEKAEANSRERETDYLLPGAKPKPGMSQFEKDIGEVAEGLHTKTIVSAFTRGQPPKAHCISRALQLVSDSGMEAQFPKEIYSHLCKTKFLVGNKSLPPAGDRITKEDGMYALAQLFYDILKEATPTISQQTQEQYKAFVTKMKFAFEESRNAKVSFSEIKRGPLDSVINRVPSAVCSAQTLDKTFKIKNRELIRLLRDNVRKMVNYQIGHTANAVKILKKLFLLPVESGKSLQIHPRVLKYGMDEVNNLAKEARELLVDYYSQCEILYRSGAEIIAANRTLLTVV